MQLWNQALTEAQARYPNLKIYDWASVVQDELVLVRQDPLHVGRLRAAGPPHRRRAGHGLPRLTAAAPRPRSLGPMSVEVERVLTVDQDVVDDPYPVWAELRATCPVYREPVHNVVVVTRYDDMVDVARRPDDFSSVLAAYGPNGSDRGPGAGRAVPDRPAGRHRRSGRRRAASASCSTPTSRVCRTSSSTSTRPCTRGTVASSAAGSRRRRWPSARPASAPSPSGLIDRFADGGRVEMLDVLAGPLPATVIADTIGIPVERS